MRLAPKGHASVDPGAPSAFGFCDCCKFQYNLRSLRYQMEYSGKQLINTGFLFCTTCWSEPNPQGIAVTPPADPLPVWQPRSKD